MMRPPFKPLANPILVVSDAPELLSGIARDGRDLLTLLSSMPEFRVACLGRGGMGRRRFPWTSYQYPASGQWGEDYLAPAWNDFSGGENGVVLTIDDASRRLWFAQPVGMPAEMQRFLGSGRNFLKWGYFPVDSTGPNGKTLPIGMAAAIAGYDRVAAASEWGRHVLADSGRPDADWMPHGLWMDVWNPIPDARKMLDWPDIVVGCNMANQARKDWPAAFQCAADLRAHYGNRVLFWAHTDQVSHYWNLAALAADYAMADALEVTVNATDYQLAMRYSACDCTILPSGGEGFGYPIAESLACGTPCIVADYAAGPELVEEECRVQPIAYRVDTMHNVTRAVLSGHAFAQKAVGQIEKKREDCEGRVEELRASVEHLDWQKLQHVWRKWFLTGLRG
jgi:glycosyltransferase involved in cell wall biosynthesis